MLINSNVQRYFCSTSMYGKRIIYGIEELETILDSANMSMVDWALIAKLIEKCVLRHFQDKLLVQHFCERSAQQNKICLLDKWALRFWYHSCNVAILLRSPVKCFLFLSIIALVHSVEHLSSDYIDVHSK